MTTCEKCLEEIKEGEGICIVLGSEDITRPSKLVEVYIHTKCLLELVHKGELKEFLRKLKKEKGVYD